MHRKMNIYIYICVNTCGRTYIFMEVNVFDYNYIDMCKYMYVNTLEYNFRCTYVSVGPSNIALANVARLTEGCAKNLM